MKFLLWLSKHSDRFFKGVGFFLSIDVAFSIFYFIVFIMTWSAGDWQVNCFFLKPNIFTWLKMLFITMLCFNKKYIAFPLLLVMSFPFVYFEITNIFSRGGIKFDYPLSSIFLTFQWLELALAIVGTLLWIYQIKKHGIWV